RLLFLGRLLALLFDLRLHDLGLARLRRRGLFGRQQGARLLLALAGLLALALEAAGSLLHLGVEIGLRAQAQRDGILRREVRGIPMAALADLRDRRFGRADEAHDLAVLELRVI